MIQKVTVKQSVVICTLRKVLQENMTEETYTFFQQFHGYDNLYNAFHMFKLK
jgi:hypothetical protein